MPALFHVWKPRIDGKIGAREFVGFTRDVDVVLLKDDGMPGLAGGAARGPFEKCHRASILDFDNRVGPLRRATAEIGTASDSWDALERRLVVAMDMPAETGLDVVLLQQVQHDVIVGKPVKTRVEWIMRNEQIGRASWGERV